MDEVEELKETVRRLQIEYGKSLNMLMRIAYCDPEGGCRNEYDCAMHELPDLCKKLLAETKNGRFA